MQLKRRNKVSNGKTEAMVRVGKQRSYIGEGEFNKAFADAKAAGKKTFTWDGRLYPTETAEKPEKKKLYKKILKKKAPKAVDIAKGKKPRS